MKFNIALGFNQVAQNVQQELKSISLNNFIFYCI